MILVTGGTGLVGAHLLCKLCKTNDFIIATYRSKEKIKLTENVFSLDKTEKNLSKIKWVQADILNIPSLETIFDTFKISQVYHCAAMISFDPRDYFQMRKINIEGTANLVNLSIDYKIQKLCYVSSIATLGEAINNQIITEETPWNEHTPKSGYAITKHGAEMEVWRGSQEGLAVVIVNPGVILGAGFNDGSSKIFSQVKNGFKFYTEGKTGFVAVTDVVNIMQQLMDSVIKNERFILVSENKSFKDIFFQIADELGVQRPSIKIGKLATSVFWRIDWFISKVFKKPTTLTKHSAKSAHCIEEFSSEKIKKTLNITFENMENTISKVCRTI